MSFLGCGGTEEGEGGATDSPPPLEAPLDAVKVEINTGKASVTQEIISATSQFQF